MVVLRLGRQGLVWMTNVSQIFLCVSSVQTNELLVSLALCNGRDIIAKFLMNRLYYEQSPKNDLTFV